MPIILTAAEEKILVHIMKNGRTTPRELFSLEEDSNKICLKLKELKLIRFVEGAWFAIPKVKESNIPKVKKSIKIKKEKPQENWKPIAKKIFSILGGKEYKDYLQILGFAKLPTKKELETAYKSLMKVYNPSNPKKVLKIKTAYNKLKVFFSK